MKKITSILMLIVILLSFAGCADNTPLANDDKTDEVATVENPFAAIDIDEINTIVLRATYVTPTNVITISEREDIKEFMQYLSDIPILEKKEDLITMGAGYVIHIKDKNDETISALVLRDSCFFMDNGIDDEYDIVCETPENYFVNLMEYMDNTTAE